MSPPSIRPEWKWVRRLKQGLGGGFPSSLFTNTLLIGATAFPSLEQSSLPHDLSLGGDDENPIALCCKPISSTRIFNEHKKENRGSDWHPGSLRPRTVGGHSDGPASVIRPHLRQRPAEMSIGSASPRLLPCSSMESTTAVSGMLARRDLMALISRLKLRLTSINRWVKDPSSNSHQESWSKKF